MIQNEYKTKRYYFVICILVGAFVLFLTSSLNYITDDWHFKFIFSGFMPQGDEARVKSLNDVILSMRNYYSLSGGRVLAHGLLYVLLMFPKTLFNVLNAILFTVVGLMIHCFCYEKENRRPLFLAITYMLMFMFLPSFGDTCLWMAGATNYLWMSIIPLSFLLCFHGKKYVLSLFFALLSGFTNEATSGMMIVYLVTYFMLNRQKIDFKQVLQIVLFLPGMLFILLAPGNYNRAVVINDTQVFSFFTTLNKLGRTLKWIVQDGYIVLIIFILLMLIVWRKQIRLFYKAIPFFAASISGMGALTLSGTFFSRAEFLNVVFLIIVFGITLDSSIKCFLIYKKDILTWIEKRIPVKKLLIYVKFLVCMVCIAALCFFAIDMVGFMNAVSEDEKKIEQIQEAVNNHETSVLVPRNVHYTGGKYYPDEGSCSKDYEAAWMGLYYGIRVNLLY